MFNLIQLVQLYFFFYHWLHVVNGIWIILLLPIILANIIIITARINIGYSNIIISFYYNYYFAEINYNAYYFIFNLNYNTNITISDNYLL